jgi:hypothetical protein
MNMRSMLVVGVLVGVMECGGAGLVQAAESGRTFFVSSTSGDDGSDGLSPQSAWRSLRKVNAAELRPGDKVLFQRGGSWRGTLVPHSGREGAPVTYGAYGKGARPLLLGSVSRSDPGDWHQEGDNIWATSEPTTAELALPADFGAAAWSVYTEGGAKVKTAVSAGSGDAPGSLQIECLAGGERANHIQLIMPRVSIREGDCYLFGFSVRCTKAFVIPQVALMKRTAPWTGYGQNGANRIEVGTGWSEQQVRFVANRTAEDGRITVFLGGALPTGARLDFLPVSW